MIFSGIQALSKLSESKKLKIIKACEALPISNSILCKESLVESQSD